MSAERDTASHNGGDLRAGESFYVVRVEEHVDERIAGHDTCVYVSPPASRESALALVGLLLGSGPRPANGASAWTHAVPGGRRTITLAPATTTRA
jgi:hypothetical protein